MHCVHWFTLAEKYAIKSLPSSAPDIEALNEVKHAICLLMQATVRCYALIGIILGMDKSSINHMVLRNHDLKNASPLILELQDCVTTWSNALSSSTPLIFNESESLVDVLDVLGQCDLVHKEAQEFIKILQSVRKTDARYCHIM